MMFENIHLTTPDWSLFSIPPSNDPNTLPPPAAGSSLNAPFYTIPPSIFNAVLDVKVPITIACGYLVAVTFLNAYNRNNGNKPWAISKTNAFFIFVVLHNIFLAVYSGWTFLGMWGALSRTLQSPTGPTGLVGLVDSLCKLHGPSGISQAITYHPSAYAWISQSPETVHLSASGLPDSTDLGRLWNEGLAFYGWIFYLSKFYEVIDTLIIIAKGKRSPTLQTYHHAGAMMCMWSGIRYMSPPIWMFCFVNSFIHTLMYTYYTLAALSIRVPTPIKRSLTTMQIIQFLVGASYASLHSFISYDIPVQVMTNAGSGIIESVKNALPSTTSAIAQAATSGLAAVAKKLLFQAAGAEGVAENVGNPSEASPQAHVANPHPRTAIAPTYHTEYQRVQCVDTSGQTFGIWLNVFYLTPLTFLFVRFFIKAYIRRSSKGSQVKRIEKAEKANGNGQVTSEKGQGAAEAKEAAVDALKGIDREMNGNGGSSATMGSPAGKTHARRHA